MIPQFKNRPACEGTDTELWFPVGTGDVKDKAMLTRICNGCSAKYECLEYSLKWNVDGFWAGTTARDRTMLRRKRNLIPKPLLPEWELNKRGA